MTERDDSEDNYPPPVHDRSDKPVSEDAAERIEQAKEAARQRRRELGLPDLLPEELEAPKRGKAPGKRWKKHGQFMKQGSK